MAQIQVISGVERRRRWSKEQKQALVAAAFAPRATVSDIARQADIGTCLIYRWRRELQAELTGFAEMVVSPVSESTDRYSPAIEITLGNGVHMRIPPLTSPYLAAAVVKAMVRR
jgi:transposase